MITYGGKAMARALGHSGLRAASKTVTGKATASTFSAVSSTMSGGAVFGNLGRAAGSLMDSAARGLFTASTAPFAAIGYPLMAGAGKLARAGWGLTKGAGRAAMSYAGSMGTKQAGVTKGKWVAGTAAAMGAMIVPYKLGQGINKKMREKDRTSMGLTQALYHVHG